MRTDFDPEDAQALVHDVNNRLAALLAVLELAADPQAPVEEHADAIRSALRHARGLADGIRTMAEVVEHSAALAPGTSYDSVADREPPG